MKTRKLIRLIQILSFSTVLFPALFAAAPVSGEEQKLSLAVFPFENLNRDPEQEYLSGIISSLIRQGLSRSEEVFLVDRENMEEVMKEQKLQFTGILDEETAVRTGKLVGASYIIKGGYVFLGEDLFLNLDLIDTETSRSLSFSERGYQENTVNALTEKLLLYLTDKEIDLQSDQGERTIIAVRQQTPGMVHLFSRIIDARVYIDGKFVAYTTGNSTVPLEIPLDPGRHVVRTHLNQNFGIIHEPEILFSDWTHEFVLKPGETLVLEDETGHFNSKLYNLSQQLWERITINPRETSSGSAAHNISFLDRQGEAIKLELILSMFREEDGTGRAVIDLIYQGREEHHEVLCLPEEEEELEIKLEKLDVDIELDCSYPTRWDLSYSVWRSDIYQGLHREEAHLPPGDGSKGN